MKVLSLIPLVIAVKVWANSPQKIVLNPSASVTCQETLKKASEALNPNVIDHILGDPIVMEVGLFHEIRDLALSSGMSRGSALQATNLLNKTLRRHRGQETVLGTTLHYIEKHQRSQKTLLICVLSGSCFIPAGTIFIPDESRIALAELGIGRVREPKNGPHMILINGGPSPYKWRDIKSPHATALAWVIDLLTSSTAFADYELISDWIDANEALLNAGHKSDDLFDHYASLVPTRRIDIGFFRVLSSSRASAVAIMVAPLDVQSALRVETMKEIHGAFAFTGRIVNRFNLQSQNIIEFGERVTKEMASTVRRAASLAGK